MGITAQDICGTLSPELKLLLLASKPKISISDEDTIDKLLAGSMDWELVLQLAVYHGVYPLLYRSLGKWAYSSLPAEVLSILRQECRRNTADTLQRIGQYMRLLRVLEQHGVRAVVLKGFPLAFQLYGDVSLRPSLDLDLFVWPEDREKARLIIEQQGYEASFTVTPALLQKWAKTSHHLNYWNKGGGMSLELHWRLGRHGLEIPLTEIDNRLTKMQIAGQSVYTLGREEQLLFLIIHGTDHAWCQLKWLCDIGAILTQQEICWNRLYQLAEGLGMREILIHAIILTQRLLKPTLPEAISSAIAQDTKGKKLASMALPIITAVNYRPDKLTPLYYHKKKYEFSLQCGWRKKMRWMHRYISPAATDVELVSLPQWLYPIYYLLRPVTWYWRRVWKGTEI